MGSERIPAAARGSPGGCGVSAAAASRGRRPSAPPSGSLWYADAEVVSLKEGLSRSALKAAPGCACPGRDGRGGGGGGEGEGEGAHWAGLGSGPCPREAQGRWDREGRPCPVRMQRPCASNVLCHLGHYRKRCGGARRQGTAGRPMACHTAQATAASCFTCKDPHCSTRGPAPVPARPAPLTTAAGEAMPEPRWGRTRSASCAAASHTSQPLSSASAASA